MEMSFQKGKITSHILDGGLIWGKTCSRSTLVFATSSHCRYALFKRLVGSLIQHDNGHCTDAESTRLLVAPEYV